MPSKAGLRQDVLANLKPGLLWLSLSCGSNLRVPANWIPMRVCIVIPVFNEEKRLRTALIRLHPFLTQHVRMDWELAIVDNGSTDRTLAIAESLGREFPGVRVVHLDEKGRGGALKRIWLESGRRHPQLHGR